jgi:hypothetical protein
MNGANAVPCARKSKPLKSTITTMIGASHNFFLSRMKAQSSLMTDSTQTSTRIGAPSATVGEAAGADANWSQLEGVAAITIS